MATHSSVLAWRIPGTVDPGRLLSMRLHRVGPDWSDLVAAAAAIFSLFVIKSLDLHVIFECVYFNKYWWLFLLHLIIVVSATALISHSVMSNSELWGLQHARLPCLFHHLRELAQAHVDWVHDAIQQSHPLSSPSPSAFNLSQHQGLF